MIRLRPMLVLCAVLALTVGVATATAGEAANPPKHQKQLCKEGGWQTWVRAEDHTPFQNKHDCYSYVAHGGTLTATAGLLACQALGGNFATATAPTLWTCNDWPTTDLADFTTKHNFLYSACLTDGGNGESSSVVTPYPSEGRSTCSLF